MTGIMPYAKALGEGHIIMAIVQEQPPGDISLLLPKNLGVMDSESALALQFLYSAVPQCWDFKPERRPSMFTLLSRISNLSSDLEKAAGGTEGGGLDNLDLKARPAETSDTPSSGYGDQDEGSQEGKQGAQHATQNTLLNGYSQNNSVVERKVEVSENEAAMRETANRDEQRNGAQSVADDKAPEVAPSRQSSDILSPTFINVLGSVYILAISTIVYQGLRTPGSLLQAGPGGTQPDQASGNTWTQSLSTMIWPAAFILSLGANVYLINYVLRRADPTHPGAQTKPNPPQQQD